MDTSLDSPLLVHSFLPGFYSSKRLTVLGDSDTVERSELSARGLIRLERNGSRVN